MRLATNASRLVFQKIGLTLTDVHLFQRLVAFYWNHLSELLAVVHQAQRMTIVNFPYLNNIN